MTSDATAAQAPALREGRAAWDCVCLTVDVDWADDAVLHELRDTLDAFGIRPRATAQAASLADRGPLEQQYGFHSSSSYYQNYLGTLVNVARVDPSVWSDPSLRIGA
jgi:hypothetical protein